MLHIGGLREGEVSLQVNVTPGAAGEQDVLAVFRPS